MPNLADAQKTFRHLNAFVNVLKADSVENAVRGPLAGLSIAIKDNICTKDLPTTCGSRGLKDFTSPYDATVVARLRSAGAVIAGKTNLDEFGMGSHSTHTAFGPVHNKLPSLSAGGSSGGSAVAVATGQCDAALGTDTGGSVRLPAAYNDVYGFKPSYGLVSRWGVVAYANSLDTVGFIASHVSAIRSIFTELSSYDALDPTNLGILVRSRLAEAIKQTSHLRQARALRIGIPAEYNIMSLSPSVRKAWQRAVQHLSTQGHTVHAVSLPTTRLALSAYYVLAPAEASSNLAKYDGVRYGSHFESAPKAPEQQPRDSSSSLADSMARESIPRLATHEQPGRRNQADSLLYAATRHASFHPEIRRRILLGAYTLSSTAINNYFLRAQRIRRLVQEDFDHIFSFSNMLHDSKKLVEHQNEMDVKNKIDVLVAPTAPTLPPYLDNLKIEEQDATAAYATDVFTVPASLAGLPAISVPIAIDQNTTRSEMGARSSQTSGQANGTPLDDVPQSAGIQVIAQFGDDELCLHVAELLKDITAPSLLTTPRKA